MNPSKIRAGDTVMWDNPEGDDGPKVIKVAGVSVKNDVVILLGRDGEVTEALACELSPPKRPAQLAAEHREAMRLLRDIVSSANLSGDASNGSLLAAVENAEAWLEVIDES